MKLTWKRCMCSGSSNLRWGSPIVLGSWWGCQIKTQGSVQGKSAHFLRQKPGPAQPPSSACSEWPKDLRQGPAPKGLRHLLMTPPWGPSLNLWRTPSIPTISVAQCFLVLELWGRYRRTLDGLVLMTFISLMKSCVKFWMFHEKILLIGKTLKSFE